MGRRETVKNKRPQAGEDDITRMLRNWKPMTLSEDFFFAAKWRKQPRFREIKRLMRYLRTERLNKAGTAELIWIAKKIQAVIETPESQKFLKQMALTTANQMKQGQKKHGSAVKALLKKMLQAQRAAAKTGLIKKLSTLTLIHPGPISTGLATNTKIRKTKLDAKNKTAYEKIQNEIQAYIDPLIAKLRQLDNPSEFTIYGQDDGDELDLSECARIATGLSGYYKETVIERDIDAEIHLTIDTSGSMSKAKIKEAKKIGVVFSEAIRVMNPLITGNLWAYNSDEIVDLGEPSPTTELPSLQSSGYNSDTLLLELAGKKLMQSQKKRRMLILLCDDGPDDLELVKKMSGELIARGVIVIHMMIGVHATPDIFPIEILFTDFEEVLQEFGDIIELLIKNLK